MATIEGGLWRETFGRGDSVKRPFDCLILCRLSSPRLMTQWRRHTEYRIAFMAILRRPDKTVMRGRNFLADGQPKSRAINVCAGFVRLDKDAEDRACKAFLQKINQHGS